jgi:hypothetical protein
MKSRRDWGWWSRPAAGRSYLPRRYVCVGGLVVLETSPPADVLLIALDRDCTWDSTYLVQHFSQNIQRLVQFSLTDD